VSSKMHALSIKEHGVDCYFCVCHLRIDLCI
jgi:hypothetical protein